mgnify:CR=1 FL=1
MPADSDIKIRVCAAGVNPVDTKIRARGLFYGAEPPAILGCDGAGEVVAVGRAVTRFQVEVGHAVDGRPVPVAGTRIGDPRHGGARLGDGAAQRPLQNTGADQVIALGRGAVVVEAVDVLVTVEVDRGLAAAVEAEKRPAPPA